jgi:hypothetical protein
MTGVVLDVDAGDFVTASTSAATAASATASARSVLVASLASSSQMAGSDQNGVKWASEYDQAAATAVRGLDSLCTMLGSVSSGLAVTGLNYATADWLSSGQSGSAPGYSIPSLPALVCSAIPPTSSGGSRHSDIPGFDLVSGFIGDMWPDGDTGKLRSAARSWQSLADSLDSVHGSDAPRITAALDSTSTPELPAIHSAVSTVRSGVGQLASECRSLAGACNDFAEQIDKIHQQTERELASLLEQIAATAAISVGLTVFTAGLSDAAGALAAGGEVAVAVSRILSFIAELGATVTRVVDSIAEVAGSFARVAGISETITIRIVTIAGRSVVTGAGGAVTNVGVTEIVEPGADIGDAALTGFVAGAGFGVLGESAKVAGTAWASRAAAKAVESERAVATTVDETAAIAPDAAASIDGGKPVVDDRPYLSGSRPSFRKDLEVKVFEQNRGPDGVVRDPNTLDEIDWQPGQTRRGVWDMGHIPEQKYSIVRARYVAGEMTPQEFRDWYNTAEHYRPELPSNNRSHAFE